MSEYTTYNKKLAVKQIPITAPESKRVGSLAYIQQNSNIVNSELLFDSEIDGLIFLRGSKVAFMGNSCMKDWNKSLISDGTVDFVLAPFEDVIMIAPPESTGSNG